MSRINVLLLNIIKATNGVTCSGQHHPEPAAGTQGEGDGHRLF